MKLVEIERRLGQLVRHFSDSSPVPAEQLDEIVSLVEAGEPGVALENYCTQLFGYDVEVPAYVVEELELLGRAMGISERYWSRLRRPTPSPAGQMSVLNPRTARQEED